MLDQCRSSVCEHEHHSTKTRYLVKSRGAVKDLLPQIDHEDIGDDEVDGAIGGVRHEAGPCSVGLDVPPLSVGRVHYGVVEVEDRADGVEEVDLVAPVVPVFVGGGTAFLLWYL